MAKNKIIFFSLAFVLLSNLSCEDKESKAKIALLEKQNAQLELRNEQMAQQNAAKENAVRIAAAKEQTKQATWEVFDKRVTYYYFDDQRQIDRCLVGVIYVQHSQTGDNYKFAASDDSYSPKYEIEKGHFSISDNNNYMEFSARAGKYYFDF